MKPSKVIPLAMAMALGVMASLASANPPSTYTADSTTNVYAKPSVTDGGALDLEGTVTGSTWTPKVAGHGAGYIFTPTDFYCPIVRVTDPNTNPSKFNFSYSGPSTWMAQGWNVNSTKFIVQDSGGANYVFTFNPSTMAVAELGKYNSITDWDTNNANYAYGFGATGQTATSIDKWDFSTTPPTITPIVDVASYITLTTAQISETHPSDGTGHGGSKALKISCHTGGTGVQGTDYLVFWWNTSTNTGLIYNTVAGTITDTSGHSLVTGIQPTYYIHQTSTSRDGQYVWIAQQGTVLSGTAGGPYIWDTTNNTVLPSATGNLTRPGGHHGLGWAEMINSDIATITPSAYWWYRKIDSATDMANPVNLVAGAAATLSGYDDHVCWNQAQNGSVSTDWLPCFTSTIQAQGTYNNSPNYWGDEILGIATADRSGAGANTVWRFAHHRSTVTAHPSQDDYAANAWPNVSQNGNWVLFQSNWEETLGTRASSSYFRDDVFIVKLTQSAH